MANINVNFEEIIGKIKPMHAVGQPPMIHKSELLDLSPMQILQDANIPYSRLHDVGGPYGSFRYVDIPNIFRDFDADETDPASYDFAFTDALLQGMQKYGVEPYFRLGVTIENQRYIKAYRIHPPKDFAKWARICEHIIRHYNEGWANGFHYGITYWEIWNEPDNRHTQERNKMWTGTKEEYYELYDVTAKHLKKCFGDKIKVGGYAATGFYNIFADPEKYGMDIEKRDDERYSGPKEQYRMEFLYGFLDYIKAHNSPMDFFSWHSYSMVDVVTVLADFVDKVLTEYGYGEVETHLNEWNLSHDRTKNRFSSFASANVAAVLCAMQNKKTSMLMYYDARYVALGAYPGFYDINTYEPSNIYYVFKAFGDLYAMGNQAQLSCDAEGIYAVAATGKDEKGLLITNNNDHEISITTNLSGNYEAYLIDINNLMTKVDINPAEFMLKEHQVIFLKSCGA